MADKNIQMTQRNAANTGWDNLYPRTKASNVTTNSGSDVETQLADYTKLVPYAVTTGSANAYVVSTPTISALTTGMAISIKPNFDSTGACTLNWNSKGVKNILNSSGNTVTNLKATGVYTLRYDGTNFILQGEGVDASGLISSVNTILGM